MAWLKQSVALFTDAFQEFQDDNVTQLAAALSYYAMFSLFPLLILLIAGLGLVLNVWEGAPSAREAILAAIAQNAGPSARDAIDEILTVVQNSAGAAAGIGLVMLAIGASGAFQQLDQSFNVIWDITPRKGTGGIWSTIVTAVRARATAFMMVLGVGLLLLLSMALTIITGPALDAVAAVPVVGAVAASVGGTLLTVLLTTAVFAVLFRALPDTPVAWRDVWLGALLTASLWEAAKRLLALYIGTATFASAYGFVGTVLVLMTWIYVSAIVLFFGGEFTKAYAQRVGSRKKEPEPLSDVVYGPAIEPQDMPDQAAPPAAPPSLPPTTRAAGIGLAVGIVGGMLAALLALVFGVRGGAGVLARLLRRAPGRQS